MIGKKIVDNPSFYNSILFPPLPPTVSKLSASSADMDVIRALREVAGYQSDANQAFKEYLLAVGESAAARTASTNKFRWCVHA